MLRLFHLPGWWKCHTSCHMKAAMHKIHLRKLGQYYQGITGITAITLDSPLSFFEVNGWCIVALVD